MYRFLTNYPKPDKIGVSIESPPSVSRKTYVFFAHFVDLSGSFLIKYAQISLT